MTWKIDGDEAIRIAERDGVTICKYGDPTEGHRRGVPISEAREIAKEDASLIYCIVRPVGWTGASSGCNVSDYFRGSKYLGPDVEGVEPTWEDAEECLKPGLILAIGTRHIHVCEMHNGVAHIAWSGRIRVPDGHGALGAVQIDRIDCINGDEAWIAAAARVVAEIPRDYSADHLCDSALRHRFAEAGVPLL